MAEKLMRPSCLVWQRTSRYHCYTSRYSGEDWKKSGYQQVSSRATIWAAMALKGSNIRKRLDDTKVTFQIPTFAALMGVLVCRVLGRNLVKVEVIQLIDFCPMCYFLFHSIALQEKEKNSNTVFSQIVSALTILFWKRKMREFSYSFCIMAFFNFIYWIAVAKTIEKRRLFAEID